MFEFLNDPRSEILYGPVGETQHWERQLETARAMIERNRAADKTLELKIKDFEQGAKDAEDADYGDMLQGRADDGAELSVYQSATSSAAAVAVIAPLLEMFLTQLFLSLGARYGDLIEPDIANKRPSPPLREPWDPHEYYCRRAAGKHPDQPDKAARSDLFSGVAQLVKLTKLTSYLPADFEQVFTAIFHYRNHMLHMGPEWQLDRREGFLDLMQRHEWPDGWFSQATIGHRPWVFYMEDVLVDRALKLVDELIRAGGRYIQAIHATLTPEELKARIMPAKPAR